MKQLDALTGVRGIAAWLVVLYHIRAGFSADVAAPVMAVLAKGYLAVDLFFVLSGFVLWLTWRDRFARDGWRTAPSFIRKRIARVWPLHGVILLMTVALAVVLVATGRPLPPHDRFAELGLHVALVQNWGLTDALAWNDPSWSISTEFAAYLMLAILGGTLADLRLPNSGIVLVGVALIVGLDRVFAAHASSGLGDQITTLGLWRCLAEFGCGLAGCALWRRLGNRMIAPTLAIVIVSGIGYSLGVRETLAVPALVSALVPLIAATSQWPHNPLSSALAVRLGTLSYSTYLAHFLLWRLFKLGFVADAHAVGLSMTGLFLAVVLGASWLLHRYVEVPGRRLAQPRLAGNPALA